MRTDLVIKYLEELELPYDDYCVNFIVKDWEKDHEEEIKENALYEIDDEDVKAIGFIMLKKIYLIKIFLLGGIIMGWTSIHAIHYKNGLVDRKAECDYYWEGGLNTGHFKIIKSRMIGSTYYAAVKILKKYIGKNEKGEYQYSDIPPSEQETFAVIFLTSTNMKDYYNFSYKDMDETVGPYYYDCPKSILDVLSPTSNEYAKEWRKKCYEKIEKLKSPNVLKNLPEDTIIQVVLPWDTKYHKEGDVVKLIKIKWNKRTRWFILNTNTYFSKRMMECFEDNYELIKRGE